VLLRIEDHDRIRCREAYVDALLEDLAWLGFRADEEVPRQRDRGPAYTRALESLRRGGHVYACDCSRKDIGGERYPGRCRDRNLPIEPGRGVRVRLDRQQIAFDDLLLGRQTHVPSEQCGDLLVRDRDGHWTYQFAAALDDLEQGVTLIVRGADLADSTGRQHQLAALLGRPRPAEVLHHPLVLTPSGRKMSKARGDTGVRDLRRRGVSAAEVIGRAAAAAGLTPAAPVLPAERVGELFTAPGADEAVRRVLG
jgi:glutamyl-tRNA synthetase/glutamyl-Q tRNA(Asp) synthetase